MKHTGKIIVIAFPDTFVKMSTEFICKVLPLVGLGTKHYIKAGHAAQVLVNNETGELAYYDFGRYVTPPGKGRVRGVNTDAELHIPFSAEISTDGTLLNTHKILKWLEANPLKTHGEGRLLASVCDVIDYDLAKNYIDTLQERGSIPYGVFEKEGSNCSRFVTETILASTQDKKIIKRLNFNKLFTPSTVGNVEIAATDKKLYEVHNQQVVNFTGSALKENLTNYFDKKAVPTVKNFRREIKNGVRLQTLEGTGSSAHFEILKEDLPQHHYRIKRYNEFMDVDYDGVFVAKNFVIDQSFEFTYDSHCMHCHVIQDGRTVKFEGVGDYATFSSKQRAC